MHARLRPHHLIIHVGTNKEVTNNISTSKQEEEIDKSIFELVLCNSCDMTLSDIKVRNDGHLQKVTEANQHLKELCNENNIFLIQHDKTTTTKYLNGSKLHLNSRTTDISNTFIESTVEPL